MGSPIGISSCYFCSSSASGNGDSSSMESAISSADRASTSGTPTGTSFVGLGATDVSLPEPLGHRLALLKEEAEA